MKKSLFALLIILTLLSGCQQKDSIKPAQTDLAKRVDTFQSEATTDEINADNKIQTTQAIDFFIEPQYENCSQMVNGIIRTEKGTGNSVRYGFVAEEGNEIAKPIYEETAFYLGASDASSGFSEGLAPVKKDGKWGYIDMMGRSVIGFKYDSASLFNEGLSSISVGNKYGYIDKEGRMVIEPVFSEAYEFHNGVAVVKLDSKYGFINKHGKWLIKPEYDSVDFGRMSYVWTQSNIVHIIKKDLVGIAKIGKNTVKVTVNPRFSKICPFKNGEARYILLRQDENGEFNNNISEEGFISESGKILFRWNIGIGMDYWNLTEGLRVLQDRNGKWGYADKNFRTVIPCKYEKAEEFSDGIAIIGLNGKVGLIDKNGNVLVPVIYDSLLPFKSEGYIIAQQNNQKFLISTNNYQIISNKYDDIGIGEKSLPIKEDGKIGFINNLGKEIVKPKYEECKNFDFLDDYKWVKAEGKWTCIDKNGVEIFSDVFDNVNSFAGAYASVMKNGKWGIVDAKGNIKVNFEFEEAYIEGNGLTKVKCNGKYGYIKLGYV